MATLEVQISASNRDAQESSGTVTTTGGALNANGVNQYIALLFTHAGMANLAGATINSAYVQANFTSGAFDDPDVTAKGWWDYNHTALGFTTTNNEISGYYSAGTSTGVVWNASGIGTGLKNSPDLSDILQELIDEGWGANSGGNYFIAIIFKGNDAATLMRIESYDSSTTNAAKLIIDYTAGSRSGSLSVTQAGNTLAATGGVRIAGSLSPTQADNTVSATGVLPIKGQVAVTQAGNTLSATGTLPTEVTIAVNTGNDDGQETASAVVSLTGTATTVGSTAVYFGFILRDVPIPPSAVIDDETVLQVWPIDSTLDSPGLTIRAEINPSDFTTTNGDMSGRTKTSAGVNWTASDIGINEYKSSPSIASVVQEIVDDPEWSQGGDIAFFLINNGTGGSLRIRSYDGNSAQAPRVFFKWSTGAQGGLIATQADNTVSATGVLPLAGQASITQADNTLAATGALTVVGQASITQAGNTLAATGVLSLAGQAAPAQADNTVSATGILRLAGAASVTQDGQTLAATGILPLSGSAVLTGADNTLAATGVLSAEGSGQVVVTQADNTLAATGILPITGGVAATQADNTPTIVGVLAILGAATIPAAGDSLAATGALALSGQLSVAQADNTLFAEGEGAIQGSGSLSVVQADNTLSATGALRVAGQAVLTAADNVLAATGVLPLSGAVGVGQADNAISATGTLAITGLASIMQAGNTLSATGGLNLLVYVYVGTVMSPARRGAVSQPAPRGTVRALGDLELQE